MTKSKKFFLICNSIFSFSMLGDCNVYSCKSNNFINTSE